MNAYIKAIEYYLPENTLSNNDIAKVFPEWTEEKIFEKVGIKTRHIVDKNETALDMAGKAALKLFENNPEIKESVDLLIFCTQSPDYKLPTSACILQDRLKLNNSIGAFDFNLGCSGYVYGLSIAKAYVEAGMAKNVLLLTGETYSKYIYREDKGNLSIFGDGASATIISNEGRFKIGNFEFGTDGSGFEKLIVRNGGARDVRIPNLSDMNNYLYMDGSSIFSFTLKVVPDMISKLLSKNSQTFEDIDLFVFHQANVFILEFLRKKLKIPSEKFAYFIENVGNTVSSTIPIVLSERIKNGSIINNKNIILAGFGVGLSWACCNIEIM